MAQPTAVSTKHYTLSPNGPLCSTASPSLGRPYNTLPYSDWSALERILLSLSDQFKNFQNKLNLLAPDFFI